VGTLQILNLVNKAWIYGILVFGFMDLVVLLVLPLPAFRGHINNWKWKAYSNAIALFLVSIISMGSALLLYLQYPEVLKKGFHSLCAWVKGSVGVSDDEKPLARGRAVVCLWFLALDVEGILFLGLAFVSIFWEGKYEILLTVWNRTYLFRLEN
jgi:hypothetical protein